MLLKNRQIVERIDAVELPQIRIVGVSQTMFLWSSRLLIELSFCVASDNALGLSAIRVVLSFRAILSSAAGSASKEEGKRGKGSTGKSSCPAVLDLSHWPQTHRPALTRGLFMAFGLRWPPCHPHVNLPQRGFPVDLSISRGYNPLYGRRIKSPI